MYHTTIGQVYNLGVFPIIVIEDANHAVPLGRALIKGGLPCAEFTFRTEAAADAIRMFAYEFPELLLGAGTILGIEQAHAAISAGVKFIVSPGFNPRVVDYCLEQGVTVFPGVCTPTEIEAALSKGLNVLKFFPAEAIGGLNYLKALCGPFRTVRFIPTGGINAANLKEYLLFKNVIACGGSWMVDSKLIDSEQFGEIRKRVRQAVTIVKEVRERSDSK